MVILMKVTGNKIKEKDKENISELMEVSLKASGNKIKKKMVLEKFSNLMVIFMKATGNKIKEKGKENL